ncbi:MAG: serine hydrolase [Bacteroidota bacterium]
MFKYPCFFICCILSALSNYAQEVKDKDLVGEWIGIQKDASYLTLNIKIQLKGENAILTLSKNKYRVTDQFKFSDTFKLELEDNLTFSGEVNEDRSLINGFIGLQRNFYPVELYNQGDFYIGRLNFAGLHHLKPNNLRLRIREVNENGYTLYPMFGTLWVSDFKQEKNKISFNDYQTGLQFEGQVKPSEIAFEIRLAGHVITKILFKKTEQGKPPLISINQNIDLNDGWEIAKNPLSLPEMETDIQRDRLVGVEGVLIARNGKIVYENYFSGFDVNTPHDTRSASKSVASAMIGIAIDDGIIESVEEKLFDFIPQEYQYTKDPLKSKITVNDLLTMRSGLDVSNKAYEGYYQEEADGPWLKTVLEAPMVHEPGTYADYGSANPFLLGVYLKNRLDIPLEFYMHKKLFEPLGITNYVMNTDDTGILPYFGGGLNLTPRDMLKFGQLYLNGGSWNGKQIISNNWIQASFKKHTRLQDFRDKDEYGYYWYHHTYAVNGKSIATMEARGSGGQFIFVVPQLEVVAVITAGNYRNGKTNQSLEIFRDYILPALSR